MFKLLFNLTAPESVGGGGGSTTLESKNMSTDDMIDFMGQEDEKKDVIDLTEKPTKKVETKEKTDTKQLPDDTEETDTESQLEDDEEVEDETIDELQELEDEIKEPDEEQLELVTPVRRRDILKKYPDLFKEFPYLEKAYYREQQFTELLPTIEDAKAAVEKSKVLDRFESDVTSGNTETILRAVKETSPDAFLKIVDNYLPTLAKVDEKAFFHVIGNVTKHTIINMVNEARRLGVGQDKDGNQLPGSALQMAAHLLNQFVFGTSDFVGPKNLAKEGTQEDNTRERQLNEREQRFVRDRFESSRGDLNSRVNNTLRNTIEANIDPKSSMTDYVRKNASRDALDTLENLINKDARFKSLVDKLWEKAFEDNFSRTSTDRIRSAYVSKAKTLLPSVIKKARIDALRGMGKRVKEDTTEESTSRKGPVSTGRPRSQENRPTGKIKEAKDIPRGMSTLDFLNSD